MPQIHLLDYILTEMSFFYILVQTFYVLLLFLYRAGLLTKTKRNGFVTWIKTNINKKLFLFQFIVKKIFLTVI